MDPVIPAAMVFVLLIILMIGGTVLLYPLSRQLGRYLENRLREGEPPGPADADIAALHDAIRALEAEVSALADRQSFTESLLDSRPAPAPDRMLAGEGPKSLAEDARTET